MAAWIPPSGAAWNNLDLITRGSQPSALTEEQGDLNKTNAESAMNWLGDRVMSYTYLNGLSIIGNTGSGAGNASIITAANNHYILRRSGTTLGFGSIDISQPDAVGSSVLRYQNGGLGLNTIGTAGQQIRVNGAANGYEFFTGTTIFSVENGLYQDGDVVRLGGLLTEETTIDLDSSHNFIFQQTPSNSFVISRNSDVSAYSGSAIPRLRYSPTLYNSAAGVLISALGASVTQGATFHNRSSSTSNAQLNALFENSAGESIFRLFDNMDVKFGSGADAPGFYPFITTIPNTNGTNLFFNSRNTTDVASLGTYSLNGLPFSGGSTQHVLGLIKGLTTSASGSEIYSSLFIGPTINQTGSGTGFTYGIYSRPTITSAYNYRAFQFETAATYTPNAAVTSYLFGNINAAINASANNQTISSLDIILSGSDGAFTGVSRRSLRLYGGALLVDNLSGSGNRMVYASSTGVLAAGPLTVSGNDLTALGNFGANSLAVGTPALVFSSTLGVLSNVSGTGFLKLSGYTISFDNSTYVTSTATTGFVPKMASASSLVNSLMSESGTNMSINGTLTVAGTNGFTVGNVAGTNRIQNGTSATNAFSFLTTSNGLADLYFNANYTVAGYYGATTNRNFQGIGTSPIRILAEGTDFFTSLGAVIRNSNDTSGGSIILGKSRGTTVGSYTIVQDGDNLGSFDFAGADGAGVMYRAARVAGQVDGTPGAADMPGRLIFLTSPDGASNVMERMRITRDGLVGIGKTPGTGALLDVNGATKTLYTSGFYLDNSTAERSRWYETGSNIIINRASPTGFKLQQANTDQFEITTGGNFIMSYTTSLRFLQYTNGTDVSLVGQGSGATLITYNATNTTSTGGSQFGLSNNSAALSVSMTAYNTAYAGSLGAKSLSDIGVLAFVKEGIMSYTATLGLSIYTASGTLMSAWGNGTRYENLQVGNAGLSAGQLYQDTAANILANGDNVVGIKV